MSRDWSPDEPVDAADLDVVAGLARVLDTLDPVPAGITDRILFALTLEGLHAEVMELHRLVEPEPALRGSEPDLARTITFTGSEVTAMISLSSERGLVRVDGWVAPAGRYAVELHRPDGVVAAESDDDGRFVLQVPPGPASLVLRQGPDGPAVSTPVVEL